MKSKKMMEGLLIKLLNKALWQQGITNIEVSDLSGNFKRARTIHYRNGKVAYYGVVEAETILPKGAEL